MGNQLVRQSGRYWILYYQQLPESGERIAMALAFEELNGTIRVEYDSTFAKVLKIFPDTDPQCLSFALDGLRGMLEDSFSPQDQLNALGPQIAVSQARRISVPVTESVTQMLLSRYVLLSKKTRSVKQRVDNVATEIEAYIRQTALDVDIKRNVPAKEILGHPLTGAKRIALAIPSSNGWTLVDGVDLNQLSPSAATQRADEISRTFWNYGRAAGQAGVDIKTVGVVLNGNSHKAPKTHEAHDYALHRFAAESSLAIDAASVEARQKLQQFLAMA